MGLLLAQWCSERVTTTAAWGDRAPQRRRGRPRASGTGGAPVTAVGAVRATRGHKRAGRPVRLTHA